MCTLHCVLMRRPQLSPGQRLSPGPVFTRYLFDLRNIGDASYRILSFTNQQPIGRLGYIGCGGNGLLIQTTRC